MYALEKNLNNLVKCFESHFVLSLYYFYHFIIRIILFCTSQISVHAVLMSVLVHFMYDFTFCVQLTFKTER